MRGLCEVVHTLALALERSFFHESFANETAARLRRASWNRGTFLPGLLSHASERTVRPVSVSEWQYVRVTVRRPDPEKNDPGEIAESWYRTEDNSLARLVRLR